MSVSLAPADLEKPLCIAITGSTGPFDDSCGGALHIAELPRGPHADPQRFVAVMATSLQAPPNAVHEQLAIQAVLSTVATATGEHLAEQMKSAFREANRSVYDALRQDATDEGEPDGVAMLAMMTSGKYVTLGLVGQDRAYLARADRLTQLTRDQRVERARSRRKRDVQEQAAKSENGSSVRLLGEADRLDARSPAIFEITLLPEDRLALLSRGAVQILEDDLILAAMSGGQLPGAPSQVSAGPINGGGPWMAAMLEVAPSRDIVSVPAAAVPGSRTSWPIVLAVLAIVVIALVAAFLLL